jgi:hypothetical protein
MKSLITFVIIILPIVIWNNFYPNFLIQGTYISNNSHPILEGPSSIDTLTIYNDGTFKCKAWGKGTYTIKGSEIEFNYYYELGKAGFHTSITRPFFIGKPRISLFQDLEFYYIKQ